MDHSIGKLQNIHPIASSASQVATNSERGQFNARTVTGNNNPIPFIKGGASNSRVSGSVAGAIPSNAISSRTITHAPSQEVDKATVRRLSSEKPGETTKLEKYLTNHVEKGEIPRDTRTDFETAIIYAKKLDGDIANAASLLGKLDEDGAKLSGGERADAQASLAASKYNLSLVQGWLAEKGAQLKSEGQLSQPTEVLIQSLQERFADRHMDVADLISLYDLDEMPQEAVSRSDRIHSNLVQATFVLNAARQLSVKGLSESAKAEMVKVLEQHCEDLSQAKEISDRGGSVSQQRVDELALAEKELWSTPFSMVKQKKGKKADIAELKAHWDNKTHGDEKQSWLPLAHKKVGQTRMLEEFIKHQLVTAGVGKQNLPDLKPMFTQARNEVLNKQSWDPIEREVRYCPPSQDPTRGPGEERTVTSTITPAKSFDENFVQTYEASGINGVNCADRLQYQHVPNLAHTELKDGAGQVLFSGLRHGVLDAYNMSGKALKKMPDADLRQMIGDLLVSGDKEASASKNGTAREAQIDDIFSAIRKSPAEADRYAGQMRTEASKNMAQELAVTALISNPEKFQQAQRGETVTLDLNSISMLTPDHLRPVVKGASGNEKAMQKIQTAALANLAKNGPITLKVRDSNNNILPVRANINVREFNFGVNGGAIGKMMKIPSSAPVWRNLMGWGFAMEGNNPALTSLVGSAKSADLGGDVQKKLNSMEAEKSQLEQSLSTQEADVASETKQKIAQLDKNITKISTTASQLKDIWRQGSFISGDREPYKMVTRLALLSHLMGETPLFNCKSGKDRTGQLDAEVKCLATYVENNGVPYAPDKGVDGLRQMRSQFTLGSGNLEMQRLNTGLPGYKLSWAEVPGLANMVAEQGLEAAYRGGSDYVSA